MCEVKLLARFVKISTIFTLYLDAVSIHHILCNIMYCLKDVFLYYSIVSYIVIFLLIFLSIKYKISNFLSNIIASRYCLYISLSHENIARKEIKRLHLCNIQNLNHVLYHLYFSFPNLSIINLLIIISLLQYGRKLCNSFVNYHCTVSQDMSYLE